MTRNFCSFNGTSFPPGGTVCLDGVTAICTPDGTWNKSAEPCSDPAKVTASSAVAAPTDLQNIHPNLFPDDVILAAQSAQKSTGCLASVTLAQWALESGFGKYQMSANNPFGMKWYQGCKYGFVQVNTREFENGQWEVISAKFIAFPSMTDAFAAHGELLMSPTGPYHQALKFAKDWKQFIDAIAPIYATDPSYSKSLISLVETYSLNSFDLA